MSTSAVPENATLCTCGGARTYSSPSAAPDCPWCQGRGWYKPQRVFEIAIPGAPTALQNARHFAGEAEHHYNDNRHDESAYAQALAHMFIALARVERDERAREQQESALARAQQIAEHTAPYRWGGGSISRNALVKAARTVLAIIDDDARVGRVRVEIGSAEWERCVAALRDAVSEFEPISSEERVKERWRREHE